MYKCAICGNEYECLEGRIECETQCLKEFKEAEALKKVDEYNAKRKESASAIYEKLTEVDLMLKEHMKEYESFALYGNYPYLKYVFNHNAWWL
jgi:hypothetical protein